MLNIIQKNSPEGKREVSCHEGGLNTLILKDLGYLPFCENNFKELFLPITNISISYFITHCIEFHDTSIYQAWENVQNVFMADMTIFLKLS